MLFVPPRRLRSRSDAAVASADPGRRSRQGAAVARRASSLFGKKRSTLLFTLMVSARRSGASLVTPSVSSSECATRWSRPRSSGGGPGVEGATAGWLSWRRGELALLARARTRGGSDACSRRSRRAQPTAWSPPPQIIFGGNPCRRRSGGHGTLSPCGAVDRLTRATGAGATPRRQAGGRRQDPSRPSAADRRRGRSPARRHSTVHGVADGARRSAPLSSPGQARPVLPGRTRGALESPAFHLRGTPRPPGAYVATGGSAPRRASAPTLGASTALSLAAASACGTWCR